MKKAVTKVLAMMLVSTSLFGCGSAQQGMLVTSLIIVIGSFKLFTEIQVLTGGGPGRATEVLATAMYRAAFTNDKMGIGSAYAVIIFVITMTLSLIQMKVSKTGKE